MRGIVVLLAALLALSACTGVEPEADPPAPPSTQPSTPPSTQPPTASATPIQVEPPSDHDLGAALPNGAQMGRLTNYTSCVTGVDVCYWPGVIGGGSDPTLSWARAERRGRWAEIIVSRQEQRILRARFLGDARITCPRGEWSLPADPRGFRPRPPTEGTSERLPVEEGGFRGLRCAMDSGPVGQPRQESHRIRAVRDDVQLEVSASSEDLVLRLFEEYVERLDES